MPLNTKTYRILRFKELAGRKDGSRAFRSRNRRFETALSFGNCPPLAFAGYTGIKIAAVTILKSIGQGVGTTEFLSVTGGTSTVITSPTAAAIEATEGALGPVAPFAVGGATALDVGVHVQCALDPSLPPNGIPIAPK